MPIRISDFAKERRELDVTTPLGDVRVVYRPSVITPTDLARVMDAEGVGATKAVLELLEQVLAEWDLVGPVFDKADGSTVVELDQPVPIRREVLQHVPQSLLGDIFTAITADRPKAKTSKTNSGNLYSGSFS